MLSPQTATPARQRGAIKDTGDKSLPAWVLWLSDRRSFFILAGLLSAILLPAIPLRAGLPDVRLEQLLLPFAVFALYADWRRRRLAASGFLDLVFAGLALSTLASVLFAPLILHSRLVGRDFYELLKIALYFGLYRLSLSKTGDGHKQRFNEAFLVAGSVSAAFGIAQYFDLLKVNTWLTPLFAPEHHLDVLTSAGRVVGTVGNPNYFGIFCVMLALLALVSYWQGSRPGLLSVSTPRLGLIAVAAPFASVGLIMSGSRTAVLALMAALLMLLLFSALHDRWSMLLLRLSTGSLMLALMLGFAVSVVEAYPHGHLDFIGRVAGSGVGEDASLGLRLARWRSLIDSWRTPPKGAQGGRHPVLTVVHPTGVAPGSADAIARDSERKGDLLRIATAIDSFHDSSGRWPRPQDLAADLVPRFMPSLPVDPASGEAYPDTPTVSGYSLSAHLENPADPDYPIYGIGSSPNYLRNGDLERGGSKPADWDSIPGTLFSVRPREALYGYQSVEFVGAAERSTDRTGIYQQHYFGRPGGNPFTATVWVKLLPPVSGQLEIYANAIYADGTRADPLTRYPADMTKVGIWQRLSLYIEPPEKDVAYLGIYAVSDHFEGHALLDGFQLVDGPIPLSFAITPQALASDNIGFNPGAKLRQSPLIGVGPEKGAQGSSIDDEYLLYAARYGLIGIVLYLALYLGALLLAVGAFLRGTSRAKPLAALLGLTVVAFLVFNITAGSFYELQLMAIFWLLAGTALGRKTPELAAPDATISRE